MSRKVKGMVQVAGVTYRIIRVESGSYSVVRITDDLEVGRFSLAPQLGIEPRGIDASLLREVARLAIHTAKTSYVGFPRADVVALRAAHTVVASRTPSSLPPAVPPST